MQSVKKIHTAVLVILAFALLSGVYLLVSSFAATEQVAVEVVAEEEVNKGVDSDASDGLFYLFKTKPTDTPIAGHDGNVGCKSNCQTVGFQNLDGKSNVVIENKIITNPNGKCLSINNAQNITIRNSTVEKCATSSAYSAGKYHNSLITIANSNNVTFENVNFREIARVDSSPKRNNLIEIQSSDDVTITNNEIRNIYSAPIKGDEGNRAIFISGTTKNVTIEHNSFFNPGRNIIQISRSVNNRNFSFSYNRSEGKAAWDTPFEDMINLFSASGVSDSRLLIKGNYLKNGGPSKTGTGMIMGDGKGAQDTAYVMVEDNVLLNPGHVGLSLAGGHHITYKNNIVLGNVDVAHWTTTGFTNNFYEYTPRCDNHVVTGNRVFMKNQLRTNGVNHTWIPGTCSGVQYSNNVWGDTTLKESEIWPF